MKYSQMIITASKAECMSHLPSLITSLSTCNTKPSGVIVLLASTLKPMSRSNKCWNLQDYSRLKKCKPNILKSLNHHKSSGYYASFGNKGSFDKVFDSSVGQYVLKKNPSLLKQLNINKEENLSKNLSSYLVAVLVFVLSSIWKPHLALRP